MVIRALLLAFLATPALAYDGEPCLYGGAPGTMSHGWCHVIAGSALTTESANASCEPGKQLVAQGSHHYACKQSPAPPEK